jgi:phosphatidylglycerol:prolipoprotein diacylglycerol transferase
MIPFFQWSDLTIGPVTIHVWGLMVSLGILAGLTLACWFAKRNGLSAERMLDAAFWAIIAGLIGSRVVYVFSELSLYTAHPVDVFKVWEGGMSFSGGLIGAAVATWLYFRKKSLPWRQYVEAGVMGLPLGIAIGRLGCFFIYDHPGTATHFFLGETYIDGVVRHNHGLYLSIEEFVLAMIFFILWKRNPQRKTGFYTAFFLLWYGILRFALDFLRATDLPNADVRYAGLTIAQYTAIALIVGGAIVWYSLSHGIRTKTKTSKEKTVR